jgi:hypothetical protein
MNATLGKPLYTEKGKITFEKNSGSYSASGTINGIEVTDKGVFVFESKDNNAISDEGHGVLTSKDGSAEYTFTDEVNDTDYKGELFFSASTGELSSFLNNIEKVTFKGTYDKNGGFAEEALEVELRK